VTKNPERINAVYLPRERPAVQWCCEGYRRDMRHQYGCRFWSPKPDFEMFYFESSANGMTIGHHCSGARDLVRRLFRVAAIHGDQPWALGRLHSIGEVAL
jgi:hypothetical protein